MFLLDSGGSDDYDVSKHHSYNLTRCHCHRHLFFIVHLFSLPPSIPPSLYLYLSLSKSLSEDNNITRPSLRDEQQCLLNQLTRTCHAGANPAPLLYAHGSVKPVVVVPVCTRVSQLCAEWKHFLLAGTVVARLWNNWW